MKKIIVFVISLFMLLNSSMTVFAEGEESNENNEIVETAVDDPVQSSERETPVFIAEFETSTGDLVISSESADWINNITRISLVATNRSVSTIRENAHTENGDMYLIKYSDNQY